MAEAEVASQSVARHDNARVFAVVLVVVGHAFLAYVAEHRLVRLVTESIYIFHFPLLVMLAGRFAPSGDLRSRLGRGWTDLLLPMVIFTVLDVIVVSALTGRSTLLEPGEVRFALWFLLSLFFWRLTPPALSRRVLMIVPALALGTIAGRFGWLDGTLSGSRTLVFLPAFLFGASVLPMIEQAMNQPRAKVVASGWLGVAGAFAVMARDEITLLWLSGSRPFDSLARNTLATSQGRLLMMVVGIATAAAVLTLIPNRTIPGVTAAGRHTLFAYLLHIPLYRVLRLGGFEDQFRSLVGFAALALGCVAISALAMSGPTRRVAGALVEPQRWLTRRDATL